MFTYHKILPVLAILSLNFCEAQVWTPDSIALHRNRMHQTNMIVLGAWAGANIIQGSISASQTQGTERAFHQMNAYWNTVNLAIATLGLLQVRKDLRKNLSFSENLKEQQKIEKILLLNTGLDAAYVMTGFYLKERGKRLGNQQTQGYGNSLLLQGSFLLVFDVIQYINHRKNGRLLETPLKGLQLGVTGAGIGVQYVLVL